jgi:hypothetical protein
MPTPPPKWIQELADAVALQLIPADSLAPIGCHFCPVEGGVWEVALFIASTEIVGGSQDGKLRYSRFHLDLQAVCRQFAQVEEVSWQAHPLGDNDELGPHVAIEGRYGNCNVRLRILAFPPDQFPAGRRAVTYGPIWEELW